MKNQVLFLFKKHSLVSLHLVLLVSSYVSFRYYLERLLTPKLSMGWSFLIDQITPLIITLFVTLFLFWKNSNFKAMYTKLKNHYLLLLLIFVVAFITHRWILTYYFWSDEVIFMLNPITQNIHFTFHSLNESNMRGYFIASYAFLYLLFGTHAWVYPLFSVLYFSISTLFVYWFIYLLTNKRLTATVASLFFATSPAYLDMFTWHSTAHAPVLILGLASLILLLYYLRGGRFFYYILSIMFFFATIKLGFIRSAGFTFIPLLLLFSPLRVIQKKPLQLLILVLPYIATTVYFISFEFLHQEFLNVLGLLRETGNLRDGLNYLWGYRAAGTTSSLFIPKLSYFTAHLFIPNGIIADTLAPLRTLFQSTSIALTLGYLGLLALLASLLLAVKSKNSKTGWLVIFGIIFIFFNMLHSVIGYQPSDNFNPNLGTFAHFIDNLFAQEGAGYGPGSRYLFIPTVGTSLLFALLISYLATKNKGGAILAFTLFISITALNTYYTVRAQVGNANTMTNYKSLVENIFRTVPKDGKPKLVFSANPKENGLERKFGGWSWLYGFYKENELFYTNDQQEVESLVKNNKYTKENFYAFYNNPHTLAFEDISQRAREYFFSDSQQNPEPVLLEFANPNQESSETKLDHINLARRVVIESKEVDRKVIAPQWLNFKIRLQRAKNPQFPFSDTIFINKERKYLYNFPIPVKLWGWLEFPPLITNNPANIIEKGNKTSKLTVLKILKERTELQRAMHVNVSSIERGYNITQDSLIDGLFTTYPRPEIEEYFFLSKKNPVVIYLSLPRPTDIGQILLNTPHQYTYSNAPKRVKVLSSVNNKEFKTIAEKTTTPDKWSPNRGKMYRIELPNSVRAKFLKIEIDATPDPVALDEITIDGRDSLNFSPEDIFQTAKSAYLYIDNQPIFKQLSQTPTFDRLTLLWACATNSDWNEQQKQLIENPDLEVPKQIDKELVAGIWNIATVNISPKQELADGSVQINCHGSNLRKVFFIGPPYPTRMEIVDVVLE